jgi:hypothetical protein
MQRTGHNPAVSCRLECFVLHIPRQNNVTHIATTDIAPSIAKLLPAVASFWGSSFNGYRQEHL